jgi:peroxiredoxin
MAILAVGTAAPEFSLHVTPDQTLSLSELRGKPVVVAFYPADWSPVCGDELSIFNEILPDLLKYEAKLVGISVDGAWCHDAFAKHKHLHFPLLSDFEPKGKVARSYVLIEKLMVSVSALCSSSTKTERLLGATARRSP